MIFSLLKKKVKVKKMQIRKIKYKNGREIYRKTNMAVINSPIDMNAMAASVYNTVM